MRKTVIVIDPGHGGVDPGAIGPAGTREADVNLTVARKVARRLMQHGADAVLTRLEDTYVSLQDRADMANREKADLFISIHCNGADRSAAGGTEVLHYLGSVPGKALAESIRAHLVPATGLHDRGVESANLFVLRTTRMPAALIEIAFITNPEEEALLRDDPFRERVAAAIVQGIAACIPT